MATLYESAGGFQTHPIPRYINDTRGMIPGLDVVQIPDEGILFDEVAVFGTSVIHSLIMGTFRVRYHAVNVQESGDDALDSERNVASILSNDGLVGSRREVVAADEPAVAIAVLVSGPQRTGREAWAIVPSPVLDSEQIQNFAPKVAEPAYDAHGTAWELARHRLSGFR